MLAAVALMDQEDENQREARYHQFNFKRLLRDANNVFEMGDESFRKHYRMYPETAIELIELLMPYLLNHERGVRPHLQVLAILRFLAEGCYQKGIAQDLNHPMSQSTFSKYLHIVIPAINRLANRFIMFPRTAKQRRAVQDR